VPNLRQHAGKGITIPAVQSPRAHHTPPATKMDATHQTIREPKRVGGGSSAQPAIAGVQLNGKNFRGQTQKDSVL